MSGRSSGFAVGTDLFSPAGAPRANAMENHPLIERNASDRIQKVYLLVYTDDDQQSTFQRLVNWVAGTRTHVELCFNDNKAFSIVDDDAGVYMKERSFSSPKYRSYLLAVTKNQESMLRSYCEEQVRRSRNFMDRWKADLERQPPCCENKCCFPRRTTFDKRGMYRSWTCCYRRTTEQTWFCSELVFSALKYADALYTDDPSILGRDPGSVTPHQLVEIMMPYLAMAETPYAATQPLQGAKDLMAPAAETGKGSFLSGGSMA